MRNIIKLSLLLTLFVANLSYAGVSVIINKSNNNEVTKDYSKITIYKKDTKCVFFCLKY